MFEKLERFIVYDGEILARHNNNNRPYLPYVRAVA